jgi:hypothetical protein
MFLSRFKKTALQNGSRRAGLARKLGPQARRSEIFRSGGMDRIEQVCDFDRRTEPQN